LNPFADIDHSINGKIVMRESISIAWLLIFKFCELKILKHKVTEIHSSDNHLNPAGHTTSARNGNNLLGDAAVKLAIDVKNLFEKGIGVIGSDQSAKSSASEASGSGSLPLLWVTVKSKLLVTCKTLFY
jgi:hypothetical protein